MTAFIRAGALALVTVLLAAPLPLRGQAASISMPKQAAQRAADASNRQLNTQMAQAQSAQQHGPAGTSATAQAAGQGGARQGTGAPPVVQSGAARGADPGARPGATAAPAPDPANTIMREVFEYAAGGRRDPFFSLMATGDLRPMLADLRLTTILYDLSGRRPVAVMNDVSTNLQYRVTTGMMLGRMRVTRILPRKVIFAIEEFGFSRADSLVLAEKTTTRQ
jgi:hypothetical protein